MLKSLDEFNAAQQARFDRLRASQPNGIACPQCGHECVESASTSSLIRSGSPDTPDLWKMACPACAWEGSRICA